MSHCDIVYKITCHDCDASSKRRQTKRQLGTRIKEHFSDINKKSGSPSVISHHRIHMNHKINWNQVKIMENEPSFNKRIIPKMIYIKKTTACNK